MGMAASQARYLALVARKSNCEYEGQQINQSRLALSNQSADLFNQMMGLEVPKTPSKSDFTYTTYTFSDGDNDFQIDKWNKLADSEGEGYNYAVTYHYKKNDNVGFQKYKYDPQVQFSLAVPTSTTDPATEIANINIALSGLETLKEAVKLKEKAKNDALIEAKKKNNYIDKDTFQSATATAGTNTYDVTANGNSYTFTKFSELPQDLQDSLKVNLDKLVKDYSIFTTEYGENYQNVYYNSDTNSIAFYSDLNARVGTDPGLITAYPVSKMIELDNKVKTTTTEYNAAKKTYDDASEDIYNAYNIPTKLGNTKLKPLAKADLDENMIAAINKIINKMKEDEIETNLTKCFNTVDGTYTIDTYIGGLYTFDQAASSYYTTYYDLYNSIQSGEGVNNIDNQKKLPTYGTQDMEIDVKETKRALIEKDKSGRFTSIKLEDDSNVYDLKAVTETDEVAYEDAMNEANYQKALYDKKVQEINAKTSVIQRQDQTLELRLKQLDTEQNALNTEIDAVSKVVKDNIEKSFKTFGG